MTPGEDPISDFPAPEKASRFTAPCRASVGTGRWALLPGLCGELRLPPERWEASLGGAWFDGDCREEAFSQSMKSKVGFGRVDMVSIGACSDSA